MKKEVMILFFVFLLTFGMVSASFGIGEPSHLIDKQYAPESYIKGWINISLNNEPANSLFQDLSRSISLIDLLNLESNSDFEYTCSTAKCGSDYSATNGEETKTFDLGNTETKILGFKFTGDIVSINSINFTVQSDAASSCYNQIEIDFLNDRTIEKGNNKALEGSIICSFLRNYGCFNTSEDMTKGEVDTRPYCQRVRLSASPGFKLGAWVEDSENLFMDIYNEDGNLIEGANCDLPVSTGEGEVFCNVDFLVVEPADYYVCIHSYEEIAKSKIRGYSSVDGCGFQGTPTGNNLENTAYEIFAEGIKFASVGVLEITNSLAYGNTLGNEISDYIWDKYGSLDCSDIECIIPIKFISGKSQTLTITNLSIDYDLAGFSGAEEKNFYELTEIPSTINSEFQKIYLDEANFSVPKDFGEYNFSLRLEDEEIFSEDVMVEDVPVLGILSPTRTASAYPTLFKVTVNAPGDVTKYEWNFGNGDIKTTQTNKITYTYNSTGAYEIKVSITDLEQHINYKIFDVIVESPEALISTTLNKKLKDLTNVNAQIAGLDSFYQKSLNAVSNLDEIESSLKGIQKNYKLADTESEYNSIMSELLGLNVPEAIVTSESAESSFHQDKNYIDLNILQTIGRGSYDSDEADKYRDAILAWNQNNLETTIDFKELTFQYESSNMPILKIFEVQISKTRGEDSFYFVLSNLESLEFKEYYEEKEESGSYYVKLDESKTIVFSTTEDISFNDLPAFIAPDINKLVVSDTFEEGDDEGTSKKIIFILIISLLAIIGFVAYIILQEWYKKKYEAHLFKNKNSLYNLINYIENAKRKGVESGMMEERLKKVGWSSEQIRYVTRKYSGKRTGMFELDVGKILNRLKKKNVLPKTPVRKPFSPGATHPLKKI